MRTWKIILLLLCALPAYAQEGIWEDSLPLDSAGGGGTDTGPVPDCGPGDDLQDGDGDCIAALTDGSSADALHTHEGASVLSTGEGGGTKFLREDGDDTSSWQAVDFSVIASGTNTTADMDVGTGATFGFDTDVSLGFGDADDATLRHNGTNLLIDNTIGYTDITGSVRISEHEVDALTLIGALPTAVSPQTPDGNQDLVIIRQLRDDPNTFRGALRTFLDIETTSAATNQNTTALNAFVYLTEGNDLTCTRTSTSPGCVLAGRYGIRMRGAGTWNSGGAVSSFVTIDGTTKSGIIDAAYGYKDEGGDGSNGSGGLITYRGLWIADSVGNVDRKWGIHVKDLDNASDGLSGADNYGVKLDGADGAALWFNSETGEKNDGIGFGGCTDNFNTAATPQTTGYPDGLCDNDRVTPAPTTIDVWLYRSADDTLKTDDSFVAVGTITQNATELVASHDDLKDSKCAHILNPINDQDFLSIWRAPLNVTITEVWCEAESGTVPLNLQRDDDDVPADILSSAISCTSTPSSSSSFSGSENQLTDGHRADININTVTGTPEWLSVCFEYTVDS